jgi:hypothetical protein
VGLPSYSAAFGLQIMARWTALSLFGWGLDDGCAENFYRWSEFLFLSRRGLNFTSYIHASYYMTKCGEALTIGVSLATEVEFRLVADTDRKIRCCRVGETARHGEGSVFVVQSGDAGALERDWRKAVFLAVRVDACLNHFYLDQFVRLVLRGDGAMKDASIVEAAVDVMEEVGCGGRGLSGVELNFDVAELGVEEYVRICLLGGGRQDEQ